MADKVVPHSDSTCFHVPWAVSISNAQHICNTSHSHAEALQHPPTDANHQDENKSTHTTSHRASQHTWQKTFQSSPMTLVPAEPLISYHVLALVLLQQHPEHQHCQAQSCGSLDCINSFCCKQLLLAFTHLVTTPPSESESSSIPSFFVDFLGIAPALK